MKPLPEQVTLAQFLSANARIMARLILGQRRRPLAGTKSLLPQLTAKVRVGDIGLPGVHGGYQQLCPGV